MSSSIAIVGMACRYPGADSPEQLWENILAQRAAFRLLPDERLRREDYFSPNRKAPDRAYCGTAAVIEGFRFDRSRFRVSGDQFRASDMSHWLALDTAAAALKDAGNPDGRGLPRETTGVFVGNTLTGDYSRATVMRLRWPYVRRVVASELAEQGWDQARLTSFLSSLEMRYKQPFPAVGDETLAGGLSNTIAGRICNHFDFKGGGYAVDGACSSSLLSVINACSALINEDLDFAVAGGVDLSLDPFEIIGFAKVGALAADEMRVYDARSAGFWPGEGCGMLALMRHEDALAAGRTVHAVIRGWGISSDGRGGITRPEAAGQLLAIERAWRRAGLDVANAAYFEGHGTGTAVGDATELEALSRALSGSDRGARPAAAIGSVKALVGHTKAAAGVAGLIKAALAVERGILPPTAGCERPHDALRNLGKDRPVLRVLREGEDWPEGSPLCAGVSAIGFGGINAHVVLDSPSARRGGLRPRELMLLRSYQDCELLLFAADSAEELKRQVEAVVTIAPRLSRSELIDLAAELAHRVGTGRVRFATVASTPEELASRLKAWNPTVTSKVPRVGFLFPGQASPSYPDGGAWARRFDSVKSLYARACWPQGVDGRETSIAQPAIAMTEIAALRVFARLGIGAEFAVGHSLGELAAWHWAGALDEDRLLDLATRRGAAMGRLRDEAGAMAAITADSACVDTLLRGHPRVTIAGFNSPRQTVISGEADAVSAAVDRARACGLHCTLLAVSHAFHSDLVAPAARELAQQNDTFSPCRRAVFSTVSGSRIDDDADLRGLMLRQITEPVRFSDAIAAAGPVDLWIEAGPGETLRGLVCQMENAPAAVAVDAGGASLRPLLETVASLFLLGAALRPGALFDDRFTRPFDLNWKPRFFTSPCELATPDTVAEAPARTGDIPFESRSPPERPLLLPEIIAVVRRVVADRAELAMDLIGDENRMLSDLHLNSIVVGRIVTEAAMNLGLDAPAAVTEYSDASVLEIAEALQALAQAGGSRASESQYPAGVDSWVRTFDLTMVEQPLPTRPRAARSGGSSASMYSQDWRIFAAEDSLTRSAVERAVANVGGCGVAICIPRDPGEQIVGPLLESARAALGNSRVSHYVMIQHGGGAASFARTLHLEAPHLATCVIDLPHAHPSAPDWIAAEMRAAAPGYTESNYDFAGVRRRPVLELAKLDPDPRLTLSENDLVLVTGGGKGIAAECALSLARTAGARVVLVGRSLRKSDNELKANLRRFRDTGVHVRYFAVDVTDCDAVAAMAAEVVRDGRPVTAFLHGAGVNVPQLLTGLDESAFLRTLAPKVQGAKNILSALDPGPLRLLMGFGSIIARAGLRGNADYAVANEWLGRLISDWGRDHPHCRSLCIDWSVWSGTGMGERLGRLESLIAQGVNPIPLDEGVRVFRQLTSARTRSASIVVASRFGAGATLGMREGELPFRRFLEKVRVHYPGIELVADSELNFDSDPYLRDHVFRGQPLFPAVMGLEAMAEAAMALNQTSQPPAFHNVRFTRPITVPATLRVAAVRNADGSVRAVVRSSETSYHIDHFSAECRAATACRTSLPEVADHRVPLDPKTDLYGGLMFQSGIFQRVLGYRKLRAKECVAEIAPANGTWFNRYLASHLELGDPGARDAVIHSIQAAIPHRVVLPLGVECLTLFSQKTGAPCLSFAVERSRENGTLVYDVDVFNSDGSPRESWQGLQLRPIEIAAELCDAPDRLVSVYLEHRLLELIPGLALEVALGSADPDPVVSHRPDGKPERPNGLGLSQSYVGDRCLRTSGEGAIGCDIELVVGRPDRLWRDLLGDCRYELASLIARETGEDFHAAASRVWTAIECMRKAGVALDTPVTLLHSEADGWLKLRAGSALIASGMIHLRGSAGTFATAIALPGEVPLAREAAITHHDSMV